MSEIVFAAQMATHDVYAPVTEGVFDNVIVINEDTVATKRVPDAFWIVPAGTENIDGWINDIDILTTDLNGVGAVHSGFYQNVPAFVYKIVPMLRLGDKIKIACHSRGCPIGALIAAALVMRGYEVVQMYLFESPNFCFQQGVDWFAKNIPNTFTTRCVAAWAKWFGDPVTKVPEPNPWQQWRPLAGLKLIFGSPKGLKRLSMIEYHMGETVRGAVAGM
jgi:hypothetical protein